MVFNHSDSNIAQLLFVHLGSQGGELFLGSVVQKLGRIYFHLTEHIYLMSKIMCKYRGAAYYPFWELMLSM